MLVAAVAGEEIDHTLQTAVESSVNRMCHLVGRQDDSSKTSEHLLSSLLHETHNILFKSKKPESKSAICWTQVLLL